MRIQKKMWGPFTLFKAVQIQAPHLYLIEILNNSIVLSSYFQSFYTYLICFTFPLITFFLPHFLNFRNCARRERVSVCLCYMFLVLESSFCYLYDFSPKPMFLITRLPWMASSFLEADERHWLLHQTNARDKQKMPTL